MNKKRNVSYIKPEDPAFLKVLKKQAGFDDRNHKFDELEDSEKDFVQDDDSEQPQVVVLNKGDLTAEEAEKEKELLKKIESETKADLSQKVIFKSKSSSSHEHSRKRKDNSSGKISKKKKVQQLLSFNDDEEEDVS